MKETDEVDMGKLRMKGLLSAWIVFFPLLIIYHLAWYSILSSQGWPQVPLHQIEEHFVNLTTAVAALILNLPDLISIGVYLRMYRYFSKKNLVVPAPVDDNNEQIVDENFGGIWIGGNGELPLQRMGGGDHGNDDPTGNDGAAVANAHNVAPPADASDDNDHHKAEAVMKTLRRYLLFALVDCVMVVGMLYYCYPIGHAIFYAYDIFFCYWFPFYFIKSSFPQMDDFGKCC